MAEAHLQESRRPGAPSRAVPAASAAYADGLSVPIIGQSDGYRTTTGRAFGRRGLLLGFSTNDGVPRDIHEEAMRRIAALSFIASCATLGMLGCAREDKPGDAQGSRDAGVDLSSSETARGDGAGPTETGGLEAGVPIEAGAGGTDASQASADASTSDVRRGADGSDAGLTPDSADSSGFPRDKLVAHLTPAEVARLCDWLSAKQGGYGRRVTCADGHTAETDESLVTCVRDYLDLRLVLETCQLTVGQMEDCSRAVGLDLCTLETANECGPLRACAG
jgi:hypothetical protein